jgi:mRNA interferase RelE/StbE
MKLRMTNQALKAVEKLDAKQYRQVVGAILRLLKNSEPHDSKQLTGAKNRERRSDAGEYRIIYCHDGEVVEILVAGKRNYVSAYKLWKRSKSD